MMSYKARLWYSRRRRCFFLPFAVCDNSRNDFTAQIGKSSFIVPLAISSCSSFLSSASLEEENDGRGTVLYCSHSTKDIRCLAPTFVEVVSPWVLITLIAIEDFNGYRIRARSITQCKVMVSYVP